MNHGTAQWSTEWLFKFSVKLSNHVFISLSLSDMKGLWGQWLREWIVQTLEDCSKTWHLYLLYVTFWRFWESSLCHSTPHWYASKPTFKFKT